MVKINCEVEDSGSVKVRFHGGHITKRELLRLLKAIKLEYRRGVRVYRQKMITEGHEKVVEPKKPAGYKAKLAERAKVGAKNYGD